jgi:hypothetical protein
LVTYRTYTFFLFIIVFTFSSLKVFQCNVEYKRSLIDSTISSARLYYNDDVATTPANNVDLVDDDGHEFDIEEDELKKLQGIRNKTEQAQYVIGKIQKKVKHLESTWSILNKNTAEFNQYLVNMHRALFDLNRPYDALCQVINDNERQINDLNQSTIQTMVHGDGASRVTDTNGTSPTSVEKIIDNLNKLKAIQISLNANMALIEDVKTKYENLKLQSGTGSKLSEFDLKYTTLFKRWSNLISQLNASYTRLCGLIDMYSNEGDSATIGSGSLYLQLTNSVQAPWQRAISSTNKTPYYINHSTETTSWDHPDMIELYKSFHKLNDIRFSAYRTAMKLRTLQKRLGFDLIDINDVIAMFDKHSLKTNNERNIDVCQIIQCLSTLYRPVASDNPDMLDLVNVVDLVLNWLLSVYDPSRCGQIRVLSMKIAIVLLCKGSIEDKYKYIYSLVADNDGLVTQRKLGLLLYEMIRIPKQLGEVAAFGGSNIEPSVRSCFEFAKNMVSISLRHFLDWLKLEPQSVVWLPVLHRLAAAENACHEAKCSICKEYPIVGFRYRSLKNFNFDICQNCFFSGRKIKGFKLDHPLLEYYTPVSNLFNLIPASFV